jgi:hypothetical protein
MMAAMLIFSCSNGSSRAQEQLASLQKKKEADAKEKREKRERGFEGPPRESVRLPVPYDDSQSVTIVPDGPCPEGLWALFPTVIPGASPAEKKANAAKRAELEAALRKKSYLVKLQGPRQVTLSPHNAAAGKFDIEVQGTVDCTDAIGRVAIAWSDASAGPPVYSAAKEAADVVENVWQASPVRFEWPMKSISEAKEFADKNRLGLSARVGLTLGKVEIDKKLKKVAKVTEKAEGETLSFGGGTEDWGAGRLVHAQVLGIRVATDLETKMLVEKTN